ncbi:MULTISPECIES: NADP-dependent succinic semialdehyde dehydrogenase [Thermomonosporaceae]|uniref:NADP-dependent succinic semialdehyde dehydrogenase n=1 Tax=Thermomonosporaceae TaxID=2012 RepID=UPI00255AD043|nr:MULTISPECIES: NADP-dependent succinic semialdehyde dehydrogenase [Thermomonosporaceae]MDL4776517.1 NADP-dependent succinic semialdehyde dehydrogenase [Actinomadura xylanilytica]
MTIATTNPATGEVERTFEALSGAELDRRIELAGHTFNGYRLTPLETRAGWMHAAADRLARETERVAILMTTEMGKTLVSARAEARKCAKAMRFYADHAAEFLADRPADAAAVGARDAYVSFRPLGPVLAVMPWNFPLWQVVRFAAPALMAGNVGLLKHASNVPQTALYLEELFLRAGFPEGAFQTLLIGSAQVERVLRDPRVRAATLTGGEPAGRSVAAIAGDEIKPTVLELGGSDPFVVMPSADVERAAQAAAASRCLNNGQSCISAKRFIVDIGVADTFERRFVEQMRALRVGDPMEESTDVGPLASERGRAGIEELVDDAVRRGARVLCGGERPPGPGWYYPPTVLTGVTPDMRMFGEEVFGPVAALYRVRGVSAAVELANATGFGLGSNAWTRDPGERDRFARELDAGQVFVNGTTTSYPELPFGGVKRSGYGRELSEQGMHAFCNVKTIWIGEGVDG